jgi:hypothetical protein
VRPSPRVRPRRPHTRLTLSGVHEMWDTVARARLPRCCCSNQKHSTFPPLPFRSFTRQQMKTAVGLAAVAAVANAAHYTPEAQKLWDNAGPAAQDDTKT